MPLDRRYCLSALRETRRLNCSFPELGNVQCSLLGHSRSALCYWENLAVAVLNLRSAIRVHKPECQVAVATESCLSVLTLKLAACHPSDAWDYEVSHRFLE